MNDFIRMSKAGGAGKAGGFKSSGLCLARALILLTAALFLALSPAGAQVSDDDLLYLFYDRFVPEKIREDSRFAGRALPKGLQGFPARDATLVKLAVVRSWDSLKPETRRELGRYIYVTDPDPRDGKREVYYTIGDCRSYLSGYEEIRSSQHFTVTYTTDSSSQDAVDSTGSTGTPTYIENILKYAEECWDHEIDTLGLTPPPMSTGKYQIYICDIMGRSGGAYLGGTTIITAPPDNKAETILELDNDYTTYYLYSDSLENLVKTTMAHEFFHAIQFGLNYYYPSFWALEATAVWAEPEVYPTIDDWIRIYIAGKRLNNLDLSFDYFAHTSKDVYGYGNSILFKHITEKVTGSSMMKAFWDLVEDDDQACEAGYSYPCLDGETMIYHEAVEIPQLEQVLATYGATLEAAFKSFMVANYTKDYAAGSSFTDVPLDGAYSAYPSSVTDKSLAHLAGLFYGFTPVSTEYSQKLTVSFTGGSTGSWGAILLKHMEDGSYQREDISLSGGAGSASVDGFGTSIAGVVLVVVNTSTADSGDGSFSFTASTETDCTNTHSSPVAFSADWNMITFPVTPLYSDPNQAVTVTSPPGNLDNGSIFYYDPASGSSYDGHHSDFQALGKTGQGYWVNLSSASTLSIQGCAPADSTITISLGQGWNMFGIPFTSATDVHWGDTRVTVLRNGGTSTHTLSEAVANGWIGPKLYWYNGSAYDEIAHNTGVNLTPWYAYWVKTSEALELRFKTI